MFGIWKSKYCRQETTLMLLVCCKHGWHFIGFAEIWKSLVSLWSILVSVSQLRSWQHLRPGTRVINNCPVVDRDPVLYPYLTLSINLSIPPIKLYFHIQHWHLLQQFWFACLRLTCCCEDYEVMLAVRLWLKGEMWELDMGTPTFPGWALLSRWPLGQYLHSLNTVSRLVTSSVCRIQELLPTQNRTSDRMSSTPQRNGKNVLILGSQPLKYHEETRLIDRQYFTSWLHLYATWTIETLHSWPKL